MLKILMTLWILCSPQVHANAAEHVKSVISCSYETDHSWFVVGIEEKSGNYFGTVEETWGDGEELDSDEFEVKQIESDVYSQVSDSVEKTITGFSIKLLKNKKAHVKMETSPSGDSSLDFVANCH